MNQALHEVNLYSRIDGSGYRNIWVVGDLHGCCTLLMNELHRVDFDPTQDLLISVGDLIDRGTENVECPGAIADALVSVGYGKPRAINDRCVKSRRQCE